jgi:hypothetical protein
MSSADAFVLCRSPVLRAIDPWLHASGRSKCVGEKELSSTAAEGLRSRECMLEVIARRPHRRSLIRASPQLYTGADRREALQS